MSCPSPCERRRWNNSVSQSFICTFDLTKKCILIVAVCWTPFPTTSSLAYIHRSLLNLCNLSNDIGTAAYMLQQCHDFWDSYVLILLYYYQLYWIKHSCYLKNKAADSDLFFVFFLNKADKSSFLISKWSFSESKRGCIDLLVMMVQNK